MIAEPEAGKIFQLLNPHTWPEVPATVFGLACIVVFLLPLVMAIASQIRRTKTFGLAAGKLFAISAGLFFVLNPIGQMVGVAQLDLGLRERWERLADETKLLGGTRQQVEALFGSPCEKRHEAPQICGNEGCRPAGDPYEAWDYTPVPFFWMGHAWHFKVFFTDGQVTGVKPRVKDFW